MDEDDGPTPLTLPPSLPYPISVTRIFVAPSDPLQRGSHLFEYRFTSATSRKALSRKSRGLPAEEGDDDAREWDMVGTWDSEVEGETIKWEGWLTVGAVIESRQAGKPVVYVKRPCDHSVQFGGLCAKCGIPLDAGDYLSRPEETSQSGPSSQKGYAMSHDAMGVTVSTSEAKRIENQSRNALLSSRMLTLIVDLDQTIIHTTVDPTVGEWMAEIESQEQAASPPNGEHSTTPPSSPHAFKEKNPNAEALEDVAKFQLDDDLPPGYSRSSKAKIPKEHERWYYTKPRPGLPQFLENMSKIYEMHVYTMGTRTYADAVCKAIDPDGSIFGGRILTRDESGSFSAKDLKRLFPTDQSMVVIIDDRSDIWSDVPNLVKVVPYDFFIGQGDINAPKTNANSPRSTTTTSTSPESTESSATNGDASKLARSQLLNELSEKRPLAKLQEQLEKDDSSVAAEGVSESASPEARLPSDSPEANAQSETNEENRSTTPPVSPCKPRRPILNNDDRELDRISRILTRVHRSFYTAYDARKDKSPNARLPLECDVPTIIPEIKAEVLEGCNIVFSGVIPTNVRPDASEIWKQAETFGATPQSSISHNTTHCVIGLEGTEKALIAQKMGIKVVWVAWFQQCVALWERLNEENWLVRSSKKGLQGVETRPSSESSTPNASGLQLSADGGGPLDYEERGSEKNRGDGGASGDVGDAWDDDEFLASIRAEAGLDDDVSDAGSEDGTDRPSSPPRSILTSPRSRAGSAESNGSQPGTPRKRVRYADEEDLPLARFKDPPKGISSPPRKRPRALLMSPAEGEVPPENIFHWKGKKAFDPDAADKPAEGDGHDEAGVESHEGTDDGGGTYEPSEAETEDEFSKMLREELGEDA